MTESGNTIVLCNGAAPPAADLQNVLNLEYRPDFAGRNVRILLPNFVSSVYHLPSRVLDLLEIAAYVFAADRNVSRGAKDAVEYHSWARCFEFHIRVRDIDFWREAAVGRALSEALVFMTGDREYSFIFSPGHETPPTSLFDSKEFKLEPRHTPAVVLFSGGLDSLAGALQRLNSSAEEIYLISHRSGQPGTAYTQRQLVTALEHMFPGRVQHYAFDCSLSGRHANEETQRTRGFLFGCIAYALAHALSQREFFAYENGVTSLNFPRRQDGINARTSRTTHPKTHALMSAFLSHVEGAKITLENPFVVKTKTDIFNVIAENGGKDLLNSAVSCSRTYKDTGSGTHCGYCFQCIDRRLAAYAAGMHDYDDGIYAYDLAAAPIPQGEARTSIVDYIRQAREFASSNIDNFYATHVNELVDVVDFAADLGEADAVHEVWKLCKRHGAQVQEALKAVQRHHDNLYADVVPGGLLELLAERTYLKPPARSLAEQIAARLEKALHAGFHSRKPGGEAEVNDMIQAILNDERARYEREYPATTFALARVVADHKASFDLLIEVKYIRRKTTPSKASEGIAADITKYPSSNFVLFVVYDPFGAIRDDDRFCKDIETKRECIVKIVR